MFSSFTSQTLIARALVRSPASAPVGDAIFHYPAFAFSSRSIAQVFPLFVFTFPFSVNALHALLPSLCRAPSG